VDLAALREALERHPVRVAVLFGSVVTGETHARSDVDIAVEFEDTVDDPAEYVLPLVADLESAVGRNDVDLALVSNVKPRVGLAAFSEGVCLVGTRERMETLRRRFERAVAELDRGRSSLRDRFDAVIENVDESLAE
jgi:predicted nucleotidyltransferase